VDAVGAAVISTLTPWLAGVLLVVVAVTACTSAPILGPTLLLVKADRQVRDGAWEEAVVSYDEYLARYPDHGAAQRVLESRDTLAAMLAARIELAQQREEVVRLKAELSGLTAEDTRLREGGTKLRAEATVLRDEVNRLREEQLRLHEEKQQLHGELNRRESDLARARQELAARRAEAERLREDIERLKQIDLQLERKR
jgi:chromosome segregation ATPase